LKKEKLNGCNDNLLKSYKFYLAFENSLCNDYISEKYWKLFKPSTIFNSNIVPIVRGAKSSQYENRAPKSSFIDASKFKTPKALANYLLYLDQNDTAYFEYFNWKLDLYDKFESKFLNIKNDEINSINDLNQVSTDKHNSYIFNYKDDYQKRIDKIHVPFCAICSLLHNESYLNNSNNRKWTISDWFNKQTNCWDFNEKRYYLYFIAQIIGFCF
jgi:hypothetical protein